MRTITPRNAVAIKLLIDSGMKREVAESLILSKPVVADTPAANVHIWAFNDEQVNALGEVLASVTEEEVVEIFEGDPDKIRALADVLTTIGETGTRIKEQT